MSSKAIRGGKAEVEIGIRDRMEKGLRRASARLRAFGSSLQSMGAGLLAGGGAMAAPFVLAVKRASDLQETMNKFDVVFGERSKEVKAWGDDYASQVGRSKKQIADFMASAQDLLVPMGIDPKSAEAMSKTVTELSVDLASFNNMADEDVLANLQSALTGSGAVMKKYGVVLDEAATKQELLNQGIDPANATNAQKAQARLNIIMAGTTSAQGDATRSAGSFANQMKALQAAADDAFATVGAVVLPIVTRWVTLAVEAVRVIADWVAKNQEFVRIAFLVIAGVIAAGGALVALGTAAGVAAFAFSGLASAVGIAIALVKALVAVVAFLVSPVGLVIVAVVAVAAALLYFSGVGGQIVTFLTNKFGALWAWTKNVFGGIAAAMKAGDLKAAANILWLALQVIWQKGLSNLQSGWIGFKNLTLRIFDELRFGIVRIFGQIVQQIGRIISQAADATGFSGLKEIAQQLEGFGGGAAAGAEMLLDANASQREREGLKTMAAAQQRLNDAQAELDAATAAAKAKAAEQETVTGKAPVGSETPAPISPAAAQKTNDQVKGTFSGAAASRFGFVTSSIEKKIAESSERTASATERTAQAAEAMERKPALAFGL